MHDCLGSEINTCLHYIYNEDILSEEVILKWHEGLDEEDSLKSKVRSFLLFKVFLIIFQQLSKFVVWLEEAAEESDEE